MEVLERLLWRPEREQEATHEASCVFDLVRVRDADALFLLQVVVCNLVSICRDCTNQYSQRGHLQRKGRLTVLPDQLGDASHKRNRTLVSESDFLLPIVVRVSQWVALAIVLPPEDLVDEIHPLVNLPACNICLRMGISDVEFLSRSPRLHDLVDGLLLIFVRHCHYNNRDESNDPLVAALT